VDSMTDSLHVEIVGLCKYSQKYKVPLIKDVNLRVKKGEWLSIIGSSDGGKSLLLNLIGGFQKPSSGIIKIDGKETTQLSRSELAIFRSKAIGYIPQRFEFLPYLTVMENIWLPMIFAGHTKEIREKRAIALLKEIMLLDKSNSTPMELSEGQRQRIAIARALANDPHLILADEPSSNIDLETGSIIINLFHKLKAQNYTFICATHDLRIIRLSDKVVWIEKGEIIKTEEQNDILLKL